MNEHPILFSGEMVRAILSGTKLQTRRVVKPQPIITAHGLEWNAGGQVGYVFPEKNIINYCPYGIAGARLWVRETWCPMAINIPKVLIGYKEGFEKADSKEIILDKEKDIEIATRFLNKEKWCPSIFMSRWASRITQEITGIRIERLQAITEEEAKAEGVDKMALDDLGNTWKTYKRGYQALWDKINGKKYPWKNNPFVWVILFKRITND
jgi:hypothetical protein